MNPLYVAKFSCFWTVLVAALAGCSGLPVPSAHTPAASSSPPVLLPPNSIPATKSPAVMQKSQTTKDLENKLRVDISQKAGINVQAVNCPATAKIGAGQLFDCQATAEGKPFTVSIRSPNDKRELQWNTKGLLVLPKLEQTIQQGIKEQFRLDVTTNCGGKIRISKPGDTFKCKVTDERGQTKAVVVQVDDERGNVTWKLSS